MYVTATSGATIGTWSQLRSAIRLHFWKALFGRPLSPQECSAWHKKIENTGVDFVDLLLWASAACASLPRYEFDDSQRDAPAPFLDFGDIRRQNEDTALALLHASIPLQVIIPRATGTSTDKPSSRKARTRSTVNPKPGPKKKQPSIIAEDEPVPRKDFLKWLFNTFFKQSDCLVSELLRSKVVDAEPTDFSRCKLQSQKSGRQTRSSPSNLLDIKSFAAKIISSFLPPWFLAPLYCLPAPNCSEYVNIIIVSISF